MSLNTVHSFKSENPSDRLVLRALKPHLPFLSHNHIDYLIVTNGRNARVQRVLRAACHAAVRNHKTTVREVWCPLYHREETSEKAAESFFYWLANHSMFSPICNLVEVKGCKYLKVDNSKGYLPLYAALITSRFFLELGVEGRILIEMAYQMMAPRGVDWPALYVVGQVAKARPSRSKKQPFLCLQASPNSHHCVLGMSWLRKEGLAHWLSQKPVEKTEKNSVWELCSLYKGEQYGGIRSRLLAELRDVTSTPCKGLAGTKPKDHSVEDVVRALVNQINEEVKNADTSRG